MVAQDKPSGKPPDIRALARNLPRIARQSWRLARLYGRRLVPGKHGELPELVDPSFLAIVLAPFLELTRRMLRDPRRLVVAHLGLWHSYTALVTATAQRMMGVPAPPVATPAPDDRRFDDTAWTENLVFDFIKQSYLLVARYLYNVSQSGDGMDPADAERTAFYTSQLVDAMAPTNFILTNPEVLRTTLESGGENLIRGFGNLLEDLERGKGRLRPSLASRTAFRLGDNIACTPGHVIYQNELIQLIQYAPTTPVVHQRPLLIVPPWINRYYILDLRPENSFVKWAVAEGFTVFLISWVDPDERLRHKSFDDYVAEGVLAALDVVAQATGEPDSNILAYCIGGILAGTALAYLAARGEPRVASATLLTTLFDFSDVGPVRVFIGEKEFAYVDRIMEEKGYFAGERMSGTFSMIRARDLIWNVVIQNYLLGHDPMPFDMLYWADDNTHLPARMHRFYLRNMYLHNKLREPGEVDILGVPIDLGRIVIPAYFLSARNDDIAPWRSTYHGARLLGGPVRFVLAGSGHIAGVINPPGSIKYGYCAAPAAAEQPDEWLASAPGHPGSWWQDWRAWIESHTGPPVARRVPGDRGITPIEPAPGSYVRPRSLDE